MLSVELFSAIPYKPPSPRYVATRPRRKIAGFQWKAFTLEQLYFIDEFL